MITKFYDNRFNLNPRNRSTSIIRKPKVSSLGQFIFAVTLLLPFGFANAFSEAPPSTDDSTETVELTHEKPPSKVTATQRLEAESDNTQEAETRDSEQYPKNLDQLEENSPLTVEQETPAADSDKDAADQWRFLHEYNAHYQVQFDGDNLGLASRTLSRDQNKWKLEVSTSLKKWLLKLRNQEFTEFEITDNELRTKHFYTSSKVTFSDPRVIEQTFDWENKQEIGRKNKNNWTLPLETLIYDRVSHLIKLRADLIQNKTDFSYNVSYKGQHKLYKYRVVDKETITTAMGEIKTIRIDRIAGDDSRFSIWLSPEYNYFPIRIMQKEQDKPDIVLLLRDLDYTPKKPGLAEVSQPQE